MQQRSEKHRFRQAPSNVADGERLGSILFGTWLTTKSLGFFFGTGHRKSHPLLGAAAGLFGLGLAYRGITGHCPAYTRFGINTKDQTSLRQPLSFIKSISVNRPLSEVEELFRQGFEPLIDGQPLRFEPGSGNGEYTWISAGQHWSFRLRDDEGAGRRITRISVFLDSSRGESLPKRIAATAGSPLFEFYAKEDLRRLKALIETGEIATIQNQPHGKRGQVTAQTLSFFHKLRGLAGHFMVTPNAIVPQLSQQSHEPLLHTKEVRI